jgi:peptide-methionine (S)-S-oxide reductase
MAFTLCGVSLLLPGFASAARQEAFSANSSPATAKATFAGGCFWCMEEAFEAVPGVIAVTSGYIGGRTKDPTYEQVSGGDTGHTEAIEIVYDPSRVEYARLLQVFWRNIDAVDGSGQFCDRGSQYRSGIFVHSDEQHRQAEASKQEVAKGLGRSIKTEIVTASQFYAAEGYHQDYYKKNPVRYKFYKWNCGREKRLGDLWGKTRVP